MCYVECYIKGCNFIYFEDYNDGYYAEGMLYMFNGYIDEYYVEGHIRVYVEGYVDECDAEGYIKGIYQGLLTSRPWDIYIYFFLKLY